MTLSITTVEDSIREALVLAGTNTRVIFFRPNAPRPLLPYTSIQYLSTTGASGVSDFERFNQTTGLIEYYGCREMFYTVNCYGESSFDEANALQGALRTITVRSKLKELAGITIWNMEPVRDLSELISDSFERRASFDIMFNVLLEDGSTTEDQGYFDTVGEIPWSNADDLIN